MAESKKKKFWQISEKSLILVFYEKVQDKKFIRSILYRSVSWAKLRAIFATFFVSRVFAFGRYGVPNFERFR